jgi:hypothetical protein
MSDYEAGEPEDSQQLEAHQRPDGVSDATVEALGKLSEAFEAIEEARGMLYAFHRRTGTGDLALGEAVDLFRHAGHEELAARLETDLLGQNMLQGRWTFQIVEEYDETYYAKFKALEQRARDELVGGRRHIFEAETKERERTRGEPDHEAVPDDGGAQSPRSGSS